MINYIQPVGECECIYCHEEVEYEELGNHFQKHVDNKEVDFEGNVLKPITHVDSAIGTSTIEIKIYPFISVEEIKGRRYSCPPKK